MLKFALVCGRIAGRHADLLGKNQIDGARLAAVRDVDLKKAQELATEFNVPAFGECIE